MNVVVARCKNKKLQFVTQRAIIGKVTIYFIYSFVLYGIASCYLLIKMGGGIIIGCIIINEVKGKMEDTMNAGMEKLISRDLGMDISKIRESTWTELMEAPRVCKRAFRPEGMFEVSGNINLALKRFMGMRRVDARNLIRKAIYE